MVFELYVSDGKKRKKGEVGKAQEKPQFKVIARRRKNRGYEYSTVAHPKKVAEQDNTIDWVRHQNESPRFSRRFKRDRSRSARRGRDRSGSTYSDSEQSRGSRSYSEDRYDRRGALAMDRSRDQHRRDYLSPTRDMRSRSFEDSSSRRYRQHNYDAHRRFDRERGHSSRTRDRYSMEDFDKLYDQREEERRAFADRFEPSSTRHTRRDRDREARYDTARNATSARQARSYCEEGKHYEGALDPRARHGNSIGTETARQLDPARARPAIVNVYNATNMPYQTHLDHSVGNTGSRSGMPEFVAPEARHINAYAADQLHMGTAMQGSTTAARAEDTMQETAPIVNIYNSFKHGDKTDSRLHQGDPLAPSQQPGASSIGQQLHPGLNGGASMRRSRAPPQVHPYTQVQSSFQPPQNSYIGRTLQDEGVNAHGMDAFDEFAYPFDGTRPATSSFVNYI